MKVLFIVLLFVYCCQSKPKPDWDTYDKHKTLINTQSQIIYKPCDRRNVTNYIRNTLNEFMVECFKRITVLSNSNFVFSPVSMWLILAAVAEGSDGVAELELIKELGLPEDICLRKQFFQLAKTLEPPAEDVMLVRERVLVLGENTEVLANWKTFVKAFKLVETRSAPFETDPLNAADILRKTLHLQLPFWNFEGNSIIIDTLDYNGLWSTAFEHAIVERAPFYDDAGKKTGYIDLMRVKMRVKMIYVPAMNAKVLELPVGFSGRYKMLLALNLGATLLRTAVSSFTDTILSEIFESLEQFESIIPLDVAIPRFRMTSEINMRKVLEDIGIKSIWTDVEGTRNISNPAALPSSFIQRSTITFDTTGVKAPILEVNNIVPKVKKTYVTETGLEDIVGRDFIVDKPFYFGLFDSKTYICLFSGIYSTPTYKL